MMCFVYVNPCLKLGLLVGRLVAKLIFIFIVNDR